MHNYNTNPSKRGHIKGQGNHHKTELMGQTKYMATEKMHDLYIKNQRKYYFLTIIAQGDVA